MSPAAPAATGVPQFIMLNSDAAAACTQDTCLPPGVGGSDDQGAAATQ